MAILLPSLSKARVMARRITCHGRLRQIALGYLCYLNDNRGQFYGNDANVKNPNYTFGGWRGRCRPRVAYRPVNPYLGLPIQNAGEDDADVFKCPDDEDQDPNFAIFGSSYQDQGNSYQANLFLVAVRLLPPDAGESWDPITAEVRAHGSAGSDQAFQQSRLLWIGDYTWYAQWDPLVPACAKRHGRWHYHCMAFLDGHVAFTEIIRGMYDVDGGYRIQPHQAADKTAREFQRPVPCRHDP